MADAAPAVHPGYGDELPYVGLRPFERHESNRFFGRSRDAQILCDRVLSGRLTILYAQSGLGKSSLLRALVIPQLEESTPHVLYFDAWAQDDPLRALKEVLIELASSLGVTNAGGGSPTLLELVRLVSSVDDQCVILILDQFEEFLVHHGQSLDPLRGELAALVRPSDVDAAVVLSLREEFLAALEPFRQQILNLFHSAYRLEPLSEADLRDAICRPATEFGGCCKQDMADELIRDLRGKEDRSAGALPLVELPMLQLVCQELWKHATNGQLSRELYESMGRAERIVGEYVRELMPKDLRRQSVTARLLIPLAPPSGLKISYTLQDLSSMTGLDPGTTAAELDRLSQARILRTRQHATGQRYELEHDAFIPVLSEWRNHVLDRSRRSRTIRRVMYAGGVAAALLIALALVMYFEIQSRTATRALLFRGALSASDPLTKALALAELGDAQIAQQSSADIQQAATAAIPAAVLRDHDPLAPGQPAVSAWFSRDGKQVSTVSDKGVLRLWSTDGRGKPEVHQIPSIPTRVKISAVAVNADRQWIAAGLDNGDLLFGRCNGGDFVRVSHGDAGVAALGLSTNGDRIIAGYEDYGVKIWNRDGTLSAVLGGSQGAHTGPISSVQFDTAGKRVLTVSWDGTAKIWAADRPTKALAVMGDQPRNQRGSGISARAIFSAALSPDGNRVLAGFEDGGAVIWDIDGNGDAVELRGHDTAVTSTSFSPDGLQVVTGSQDRTARVWDLRFQTRPHASTGAALSAGSPMVLRGHTGPIRAVAFSADGTKVVTTSQDGTARIWWSESQEPRVLGKHGKPVEKVAFSPDGSKVASASRDATVRIWTLRAPPQTTTLEGHTDWVRSVAFSPDGTHLATGSEDGTARVWDLATGRNQVRQVGPVLSITFAPDGAGIMTGSRETGSAAVKVWPLDVTQQRPLLTLDAEKEWVFCAAFSPDGSRIVTASSDNNARIWVRESGKWAVTGPPIVLPHRDRVLGAVFSPDGSKIATSSADGEARIWELSGKLLWELPHAGEVWQIGFSSDGRSLVTSSTDKTAKIWDVEHGVLRLVLSHSAGVRAAAFSPATSSVVTGADDGKVRLWRTTVPDLIEYMRQATTACLTPSERAQFLGETPEKARTAYDRCEADAGRGVATR